MTRILTTAALLWAAVTQSLFAQDAGAPKAPAGAPKAPAAAPAAPRRPAMGRPADDAPKPPAVYHPENPAVEYILTTKPTTPSGLLQAALSLNSLDRPDLAKQSLDQLLAAKPDQAALAQLNFEYGSNTFVSLQTSTALAPQGVQLAELVLSAGAAESRNSARLDALMKQLDDPSPDVEAAAMQQLAGGGAQAAAAIFAALAGPSPPKNERLALEALRAIGRDAAPPLIAALRATDNGVKAKALRLLNGQTLAPEALPEVLAAGFAPDASEDVRQAVAQVVDSDYHTAPTKRDATVLLSKTAREYLAGEHPLTPTDGDRVMLWRWDEAAKRPVTEGYPPRQASAVIAARLASELRAIDPPAANRGQLYLISLLDSAVYRAGLDAPLPTGPGTDMDVAAKEGVEALNDTLAEAMATNHPAAARAAAQLLGRIGDARLLTRDLARPSPLVAALRYHDRRTRVAATAAVIGFKPRAPFPDSAALTDSVADIASSSGRRVAAVAFPSQEILQNLAGMTNALGYETVTATNGRGLELAARQTADTELILVSARLDHGPALDTVQALRRDPRLADVPICVLAELDQLHWLARVFEGIPKVFVELRPQTLAEMKVIVAEGAKLAGDSLPAPEVRKQFVGPALGWMAQLADAPPDVADARRYEPLIERALFRPATSAAAAEVLKKFGSPAAQLALVDLASIATQPIEARKTAALAFRESVARFGLRLSPSEILRQYDRYNESAQLDAATQKVLSHVLDTIEQQAKPKAPKAAAR